MVNLVLCMKAGCRNNKNRYISMEKHLTRRMLKNKIESCETMV